ncbi:MAG: dynamin family protein [Maioricimonas sp. JB049]
MSTDELAHFEMLAQVDQVTVRLRRWSERESHWSAMGECQALLRRVLSRVDKLRIRLEAPLVVATFGGTGTGKSSLVNALVGEECTVSGRQRPTTRQPVLITHPKTELEPLNLPHHEFQIVRREADLLRDIVIIDCPDPDTNEADSPGSNLARLHALLPHCDVLIYTSTQQKYRSARVSEELGQAASGCRLVFVQTHGDLDEDIREDWRKHLQPQYEVPDVFFVDSVRGLEEQQAGQRPSGDLARLIDLLTTQLAASERARVRRANVVDLLHAAVSRCHGLLGREWPKVDAVEQALAEQRRQLSRRMSERLCKELLGSRNLWERRLLSAVTDTWGFSPFSSVLRFYNGLGTLLASMSFYRARSTAQLALIGAMQGARWLEGRREERTAETSLQRASAFGIDDTLLRESELVVEGHLISAGLDRGLVRGNDLDLLRQQAVRVEDDFLLDAGQRVEEIIQKLARRNSGWFTRTIYELLFASYLIYVLFRIGKNFFYESFWLSEPILSSDFYLPALVFFALWSGLLVMLFVRRLRRGLDQEITELARELTDVRLAHGLFPRLEETCSDLRWQQGELESINEQVIALRQELAIGSQLGAQIEVDTATLSSEA